MRLSKSVIGPAEKEAVLSVLSSEYLGMGEEVQKFEQELLDYVGGEREIACVNTGTSALHLACQAIGLGPGDEVLVPSLTYVASFQAISATGATPVACDVNLKDGLLDLDDAKARLTSKTRAIMPVHYASYFQDFSSLYQFADDHKLRVIEDAAQALGCENQGKKIGSFGDIICFSFDGIKNITSGEGGAVVSADSSVIDHIKDARLLAVEGDSAKRFSNKRSWDFDVTAQGWRYHMGNMHAALGRVQLARLDSEFKPARQRVARLYREKLADIPDVVFLESSLENVVPHIIPVRILNGKRDRVRENLLSADIQVGMHYKPNHLLTQFGGSEISLPIAEQLFDELLSLPMHPDLTQADVEQVTDIIRESLIGAIA